MEKVNTNILLKHMVFLAKQTLRNGLIIIKLLEGKVYFVLIKMICILSKKLSVVRLYLSSEVSYQDLVLKVSITTPPGYDCELG